MEITLTLVRNSLTQGGKEGRFLSRIDQPLIPEGIALLRANAERGAYPGADAVFSSPLARCVESARILYPYLEITLLEQLTAFDYGVFSGRAYSDIAADKQFAAWMDADSLAACPGGEAPHMFISRCGEALRDIIGRVLEKGLERVSVITHQSVIGAILQRHSIPHPTYRDWQADCGGGFTAECQTPTGALRVINQF